MTIMPVQQVNRSHKNINSFHCPKVQNQVHTSTVRKRIENEHQLIIFGATLMIVAAIVFIAKNRETAKVQKLGFDVVV